MREIARIAQSADVRKRPFNNGIDAVGNTPQGYAAMINADVEATRKLLKLVGCFTSNVSSPVGVASFHVRVRTGNLYVGSNTR